MRHTKGISLIEVMIVAGILAIVCAGVFSFFASTLSFVFIIDARNDLQQKANLIIDKISLEAGESGFNSSGQIQVSMLDNTGTNSSDILRLAIPICPCGLSVIDSDGQVRHWGAPYTWGESGCSPEWPVDVNGQVAICHNSSQSMNIDPNVVRSHLAHGDWIGSCGSCDPTVTNNRWVEYSIANDGRMVRRVLDSSLNILSERTLANEVADFQTTIDTTDGALSISVSLRRIMANNRPITVTKGFDVILRNKG